jgi:hypothetical protein
MRRSALFLASVVAAATAARADEPAPAAPSVATLKTHASLALANHAPAGKPADWQPDHWRAASCVADADALVKAGTPATTSVTLDRDVGELGAGAHTIAEIRAMCAHAVGVAALNDLPVRVAATLDDMDDLAKGRIKEAEALRTSARDCHELVDEALAGGVAPDTPVLDPKHGYRGTVAGVKQDVCNAAEDKLAKWTETELGAHKKLLKKDKWALLLKSYPEGFAVPGQPAGTAPTNDPKVLAKATVWFDIQEREPSDDDHCTAEKMFTYVRYQFDKQGQLVKQTSTDYCGDPGPKALK